MTLVKHLAANEVGRDFVVGDIHGCFDLLMSGLTDIDFDFSRDRLFAVGDFIDRGPDSGRCLRLIDEPWFFSNRGNHEDMMLANLLPGAAVSPEHADAWFSNGGQWYRSLAQAKKGFDRDFLGRIADLPLVSVIHGTQRTNIVHAEFPPGTTDETIDAEAVKLPCLLWGRDRVMSRGRVMLEDAGLSRTCVGHTPLEKPVRIGAYRYIDTGAVFGGQLTIRELT